ncbi:unnamed protein product, partial [marine sediment metagenome]
TAEQIKQRYGLVTSNGSEGEVDLNDGLKELSTKGKVDKSLVDQVIKKSMEDLVEEIIHALILPIPAGSVGIFLVLVVPTLIAVLLLGAHL